MQSPILAGQEAHDDYLKQLLDQRTARADSYGHLFTPSDRSDTPSVYSHSFFSPYPQGGSESPSPVDDYAPSSHDQIPTTDGCERLSSNSSLNLHEDPGSSYTTHHTPFYAKHEEDKDPDTESLTRMSVLGPKMRFHSRAPWETDLHEEDETPLEVDRPATHQGKPKFFNFTPTSPRISKLSRPSIESTRSEVSRKVSVDNATYKSLYSRATFHTPGKTYHGGYQDNVGHLTLSHSQSSTSTSRSPSITSSPIRRLFSNSAKTSHAPFDPSDHRDSTGDNTRAFLTSPTLPESPHVHPYANPDLVTYPSKQDEQPEPPLPAVDIISNDSTPTVTASSTASSVSEAITSPLTPDASAASVSSRKAAASAISGRQISTPLAAVNQGMQDKNQGGDSFSPGFQNLHGWMEKSNTPGFSLISLEEAQAQRARAVGQSVLPARSSSTSLDEDASSSSQPASESSNVVQDVQSLHKTSIIQRTRAQSISASVKAKNALHSVVGMQLKPDNHKNESPIRTQAIAGKSLKHKKSGLMRLLIGNKAQDQDDRSQPPPVPVLPSSHNHQQKDQKKMHRVPVPELTTGEIDSSQDKLVAGGRSRRLVKVSSPSKPTLPPLFITSVSTQNTSPRAQSVLVDSTERPWVPDSASLSAPAHVVDFPALQLRPVSTMFDAQFAEHLIGGPSLQPDSDISHTSSMPPTSIGLPNREKPRANPTIGLQDQPVAIRTLQQSMTSAKLAWQRQIWELEGQVRDLKAEIEGLKASAAEDYCEACGRGKPNAGNVAPGEAFLGKTSVVDRPRARTATSARFGNSLA